MRNALIAMIVTSHPQVEKALSFASSSDIAVLKDTFLQSKEWKN
jgi:hypothetical protein